MPLETKTQDGFAPVPMQRDPEPDAHGQAALLLVESLLHTLVERGRLSNADALIAIRAATEVKKDVAAETGESESRMEASLALLESIRATFAAN